MASVVPDEKLEPYGGHFFLAGLLFLFMRLQSPILPACFVQRAID
jgi:hypothetical protein